MIKTIHIKLLLLISLSILFGHSAFSQDVLSAPGVPEQVCAGELRSYRVEGLQNSIIHWTVTGGEIINDVTNHGAFFNETTVLSGSVYESIIQVQWGTTPGSFKLTANEEATGGCFSGDLVLDVTVNPIPLANLILSAPAICQGDVGIVTIESAENGVIYDLYIGADASPALSATGTGADLDFTIPAGSLTAGDPFVEETYTITIKAKKNDCTVFLANSAIVSVRPIPPTTNIVTDLN